jgi:hypothetical protein
MEQKPSPQRLSPKPKPSKKAQYEWFKETARELGVDNPKSAEEFERTFEKIAPPKGSKMPAN